MASCANAAFLVLLSAVVAGGVTWNDRGDPALEAGISEAPFPEAVQQNAPDVEYPEVQDNGLAPAGAPSLEGSHPAAQLRGPAPSSQSAGPLAPRVQSPGLALAEATGDGPEAGDSSEDPSHHRSGKIPGTEVPLPADYGDYARGRPVWKAFPAAVPGQRVPLAPPGWGIPGFLPQQPAKYPERFVDASPRDPVGKSCAPSGRPAGHYFYNVWEPEVVPFVVDAGRPGRRDMAVVVAPGGGWIHLAWEPEGVGVAEWLNSLGISAFLVKYRVPTGGRDDIQLMDVQRAMSLVRKRAPEYGLSPSHIGFMGSSAGGELGVKLMLSATRDYARIDDADDVRYHPDFMVLMYPALPKYYLSKPIAQVPMTLMLWAKDDPCCKAPKTRSLAKRVSAATSLPFWTHEYPDGKHGWGDCDYYPQLRALEVCGWKRQHGEPFLDAVHRRLLNRSRSQRRP